MVNRRQVRTHLAPTRERRDPQAATRNPTWHGKDQPMVPEWNADQAFRYGVMANVVAFRCLQVWADAAAKYPFRAGPTPPARPGMRSDHNPNARLARLVGQTKKTYFRLGYGFSRQRNGAANMHAASCIASVTGAIRS